MQVHESVCPFENLLARIHVVNGVGRERCRFVKWTVADRHFTAGDVDARRGGSGQNAGGIDENSGFRCFGAQFGHFVDEPTVLGPIVEEFLRGI